MLGAAETASRYLATEPELRIKGVELTGLRRFSSTTIESLSSDARLVVLSGPNGVGKSSLFDGFSLWASHQGGVGFSYDQTYHTKQIAGFVNSQGQVKIELHDPLPASSEECRKLVYIRSAYRNEPDFLLGHIARSGPIYSAPKPQKMIENDVRVSDNYQRLVSSTVDAIWDPANDDLTVRSLRDRLIGLVREAMQDVFDDLLLVGAGTSAERGSFYFQKGESQTFHYKNLSGGEKAAFDLLLDVIIKKEYYSDTAYCIDEPELHIGTRVQGRLLRKLLDLMPPANQLWIASHSAGMMRAALELYRERPKEVVFLDFSDRDFDKPQLITPQVPDRAFWRAVFEVALDDMADLVAPRRVVLCEGKAKVSGATRNPDFDARCYSTIFQVTHPDTDFISVGSSSEVREDRIGLARSIQALVRGTEVIRLVDRDDCSVQEVNDLRQQGVRTLTRRSIESYLLDDEVLTKLCECSGQSEKAQDVIAIKSKAIESSVGRNNPADDMKSASGEIYDGTKRILKLAQAGNNAEAFMRDTLAGLLPSTAACRELERDIFGG